MRESIAKSNAFPKVMLLVSIILVILYWFIDPVLHMIIANEDLFLLDLLGIRDGSIWQRIIIICFFIIFGSTVHYNAKNKRETEERLFEAEDRYRDLVETSTDAIISTNDKMEVIQWNRAASDLFGYSKELMMDKSIDILIPEKFKAQHWKGVKRLLTSGEAGSVGKTIEIEGQRKDGSIKPMELSLSALKIEGKRIFSIIIRETTERRRALEALRASEERYRNLFEDSKDAVIIWTSGNKILDVNQAALEIFGYELSEMIDAEISDIFIDPDDILKLHKTLIQAGSPRGYELNLKKKNNIMLDCLLTASVLRNKTGTLLGYQGIIRDFTNQKRNEDKLKRTLNNLRKAMGGVIQAAALMIETRDPYTAGHQRRVAGLSRKIAQDMGLSAERIDGLRMAGLIHDLGKIAVPSDILSKPSRLTNHEFGIIETHPKAGFDILKDIEFPWPIARIILEHHEKFNGSGYPLGVKGKEILLESRILTVADVVEAIASHRPYRAALGIEKALEEILKEKGVLYDPEVVDVCLRLFREKGYKLE